MVALDVAIVVRTRNVGRIHIDEIDAARTQGEDIRLFCSVAATVVENDCVEYFDLLKEMFLDRQAEIAAAVIVVGEIS